MPRNFKFQRPGARGQVRDLAQKLRIVVGVLAGLNLVAVGLVLYPPGGSADDLEHQFASLQSQVAQKRALLEQTRKHVAAVEAGREQGDKFLIDYFLGRRSADSTLLSELTDAAAKAQIKERDRAQTTELIEGSDTLGMMTITANYEGTYRNLLNFIAEIDRSPRLLIIESLNAAPQRGTNTLAVSMKINAFVREEPAVGEGAAAQ